MTNSNYLAELRQLDDVVLAEVVREGEIMLLAQFQAATASDQRSMAWAGFIITVDTAVIGACFTLGIGGKEFPLAIILGLLAVLLAFSALKAIQSVLPSEFYIPGNRPANWLPSKWEKNMPRDLHQARIEQARCLETQIEDNREWAKKTAATLSESMILAVVAVFLAGIYAGAYAIWKLLS